METLTERESEKQRKKKVGEAVVDVNSSECIKILALSARINTINTEFTGQEKKKIYQE